MWIIKHQSNLAPLMNKVNCENISNKRNTLVYPGSLCYSSNKHQQ